jgi:hypothetical protein
MLQDAPMSELPSLARVLHHLIEPLHAVGYFAPESTEEYEALGLEPVAQGYVAGRAAPLGAVGPELARAVFYNFSPQLIGLGLPGAWDVATPHQVLAARWRAVDRIFARIGAPTGTVEEATALARDAAAGAELAGRPLAAANAGVVAPASGFAALWQALTVLREHRGDGHVALLTAAGIGPVETLALYASWQEAISRRFLQRTRLWDDEAWDAAEQRLRARGWMAADGTPTEAGLAWRDRVEADTDRLARGPYDAVGVAATRRLFALLEPVAVAVRDAEMYPRPITLPTLPD